MAASVFIDNIYETWKKIGYATSAIVSINAIPFTTVDYLSG